MLNLVRSNFAFVCRGAWFLTAVSFVLLTLCRQGFAQSPEILVEGSDYTLGLEAFSGGEFERAANLWLAEAYNGSMEAQFNVGVLYVQGKGVTRNRVEAAFWFEKAAEQGHPEAQYNLGHLILEDQDDVTLITEGINWWRRSAEQDFAIAQYNYGRAVFHGIGVAQDREAAKEWIDKAANAGVERAITFLSEHVDEFTNEPAPQAIAQGTASSINSAGRSYSLDGVPPSEDLVNSSEYMLIGGQPILMYSRFNTFAPVVMRINARVLLRVVERARNWMRVEIPGGVPGWVKLDHLKVEKGFVEINQERAVARTDPSESTANNDLGELVIGTRLILLEQQGKWARVLLPENIPGWIEDKGVKKVKADAAEISRVWQAQRVRLKVSSLSSREVQVAENSVQSATTAASQEQSATTTISSGEARQQSSLSDLPSDGLPLPEDENGVFGPNIGMVESGLIGAGRYERSSITKVEKVPDRPTVEPPELAVVSAVGDIQLSGTGVTNDNKWLFEESSKDFTLQLFSIRNQSSAMSQFRSLNGRGQLFSTSVKSKRWYFLLFGKFLTRESAELAFQQLPTWARKGRVRSLKRLQVSRCNKIAKLDEQEAQGLEEFCS